MDDRDLRAFIIHTRDLLAGGHTSATIRREVKDRRLVRLRRGAYCDSSLWQALSLADRHVLRASVVGLEVADAVLCGLSAAAAWGIPVIHPWPDTVQLLAAYRGGGASEPGVRRTVVGARNAPVVAHRGLRMTPPARTAVDLACEFGFRSGVVAMDRLLADGLERDDFFVAIERRSSRFGRAAALAAAEFADGRSESPGESLARAAIFEAGFASPVLQHVMKDAEVTMRLDFWWPTVRVAGEFDGRIKYAPDFQEGVDPAEAVWREKRREDRVRRQADGVVRLVWSDISNRARLMSLLASAGVPRRSSAFGPGNGRSEPDTTGSG
jgi:hypothetical protein